MSGPQRAFAWRFLPRMTIYEVAEKVTKITLLKVHARIPVKQGILANGGGFKRIFIGTESDDFTGVSG